ncbi:carboxymuconolactone decarboxylase family protein [Iodobacter sp. HSC-16F04]|uniref:Carboxymuconolactone decarboxylase family protein n=1 Tax=Iodobacter violaceini TaxID=3044271 RepID=A0ABX0KM54_9NEIS|nr:carboxymuconolactone decarboxylase family protein [Iodobacter violacea]NHQ84692.1 carboxymuconolactone decarboxylase family protein [Iodobacter violacea]
MSQQTALRRRGLELIGQLHGEHAGAGMIAEMQRICPDFADMTIDWAIGTIMDRPGLDLLTRELILVASCVTLGHAMPQLRAHAEAALQVGASREQIIETVLQLTFYAGGPAVRNSLVLLDQVFIEWENAQSKQN